LAYAERHDVGPLRRKLAYLKEQVNDPNEHPQKLLEYREREHNAETNYSSLGAYTSDDYLCNLSFKISQLSWHCVTASPDKDLLWRWYPSEEKARAGKPAYAKPAKIVMALWDQLCNSDGMLYERDKAICAAWINNLWNTEHAPPIVCVATHSDEIYNVYRKGPNSCMSHSERDLGCPIHPVRAYASPDVALLYAIKGDRIVARTVINPMTKEYVRVYGNREAFVEWFKANGYSTYENREAIDECRLKHIPGHKGSPCMPYLDNSSKRFDILDDDWVLLTDTGEYKAESQHGSSEHSPLQSCSSCEEFIGHDEDCQSDSEGNYYCLGCASDMSHTYCIDGYGDLVFSLVDNETDTWQFGRDYFTLEALEYEGLVITRPGTVRRQRYCTAMPDGTWVRTSEMTENEINEISPAQAVLDSMTPTTTTTTEPQ
jgi:hypothetical protein